MEYRIITKTLREGIWTINYKVWPEGECYCKAEKRKITLTKQGNPTVEDVKKAEALATA